MSNSIVYKNEGFSILTKLLAGFFLIIVGNGIGDYYSSTQMNRLYDLTTMIYNHPLQVTRAVLSADTNIVKIHRSMKDVALSSTEGELASAINFVNEYEKEVYHHFKMIEKWILGKKGALLQSETIQLFREWKVIRDEVIVLTQAGNRSQAFAITKEKGAKHVELLNSKMQELKNYAANKASEMLISSQNTKEKVINTTSIIFLVLVFLGGLFGYILSRMITDSIKQLVNGVVEFGKGNLDYKVETKFKGEINWLANALNDMAVQRKKVIEELKLQGEIAKNMVEGVCLVGFEDRKIVYTNPKLEEMFGYSQGEMVGKNVSILNAPTDKSPEEVTSEIMSVLIKTGSWSGEVNNIKKDGTLFWNDANISVFEHAKYGHVVVSVRTDITERKKLEKELKEYHSNLQGMVKARTTELEKEITERKQKEKDLLESEEKFRSLAENSQDYIMRYDEHCRHLYQNKAGYKVSGFSEEEFVGKTHAELGFDDGLCKLWEEKITQVFISKQPANTIFQWEGGDGPVFLDLRLFPEFDEQMNVRTVLGVSRDITDLKQAEAQIKTSLKDKEILLQEVHHRVKNNLQVVTSLLNLHMKATDNETIKEALKDSQLRIYAMSLTHELLHGAESLTSINMKSYLLHLTSTISQFFVLAPTKVKINVKANNIQLSIDQAIPLGLIVNELLSNALKYAFPDNSKGEISIQIETGDENGIILTICDNGIGIPQDFDWYTSESLGLSLVRLLSERQLDGSIELEERSGSCFIIRFKQNNL